MTMNEINPFIKSRVWGGVSLQTRLFVASALLSTLILLVVAWVINNLVVQQARQQVQSEIENLLPVYNAVWEERTRSLASIGQTMANAPITKAVFGDARASQDRATLHEMITDLTSEVTTQVDLVFLSDGAGNISFAEYRGISDPSLQKLEAARVSAENQQQLQGIARFGEKIYQLALTPILIQSGTEDVQNTLAVLGTGVELNREVATAIKNRIQSDIVFWGNGHIYASSLNSQSEEQIAAFIGGAEPVRTQRARPVEVLLEGKENLATTQELLGFDKQRVGSVVMIRSLAEASQLFRSISNSLLLLWSLSIAAAFVLSYLLAGRILRPIGPLIQNTRVVGDGNYDHVIKVEASGELGELAVALDQMRLSLKQSQAELLKRERLATIGQMASSIVHDLRNPLAAISTAAEMLHRDGLALERRKTLVESQLRASQRMQEMLGELLDFTRGNYSLELEHHRLLVLVERAVQTVNPARHGAEIHLEIPLEIIVTVDKERLRRVFENLLNNALQAMSNQSSPRLITIASILAAGRVKIQVRDTGPGVAIDIRDRLFEPFVSQGKAGGTGLGLAIAKSIVEAHGGFITLTSSEGEGACFEIQLPQTDPLTDSNQII